MNTDSLTSLLYFLGFGLFFYWIMRNGGCGMHAHGRHADHRGHDTAPASVDVHAPTAKPPGRHRDHPRDDR